MDKEAHLPATVVVGLIMASMGYVMLVITPVPAMLMHGALYYVADVFGMAETIEALEHVFNIALPLLAAVIVACSAARVWYRSA